MTRAAFLIAPLLLTGCTYTPQMMARADDFNVCRLSRSSLQESVASAEITRRGLDCTQHYRAIDDPQRAGTGATLRALGDIGQELQRQQQERRDAPMPPRAINCTSSRAGGTVFTNCY